MQSVRRFVAILSLAALSGLHAQEARGQEGGFQVPLNTDPVIPTPTGQAGQPGYYTVPDFIFWSGSGHASRVWIADCVAKALAVIFRSNAECSQWIAPPPLRQPKASEHFVASPIAVKLPPWDELPPEPPQPRVTLLPPAPVAPAGGILPSCNKFGLGDSHPQLRKPTYTDRTWLDFTGPTGMKVAWQLPDGSFSAEKDALVAPKERNFQQGQVYRLRLKVASAKVPERAFYPTLEVAPATPKTKTFLAHSSVPVAFTADDFAQAKEGTLVVKVVFLPDPTDQDFSTVVGAEELVSTKLEDGADPVAEAQRRGTVLAIIRMGNIDLENRIAPALHGGQIVPGITPGSGTGRIAPAPR